MAIASQRSYQRHSRHPYIARYALVTASQSVAGVHVAPTAICSLVGRHSPGYETTVAFALVNY